MEDGEHTTILRFCDSVRLPLFLPICFTISTSCTRLSSTAGSTRDTRNASRESILQVVSNRQEKEDRQQEKSRVNTENETHDSLSPLFSPCRGRILHQAPPLVPHRRSTNPRSANEIQVIIESEQIFNFSKVKIEISRNFRLLETASCHAITSM